MTTPITTAARMNATKFVPIGVAPTADHAAIAAPYPNLAALAANSDEGQEVSIFLVVFCLVYLLFVNDSWCFLKFTPSVACFCHQSSFIFRLGKWAQGTVTSRSSLKINNHSGHRTSRPCVVLRGQVDQSPCVIEPP
jgi:hypothetical protein